MESGLGVKNFLTLSNRKVYALRNALKKLGDKLAERGGKLILVQPRNTPITYPECSFIDKGNSIS